MPYEVKGPNASGKFEVVNTETQQVKAEKDTKEDAERQVRLLHEIENDPNWSEGNG